MKIMEVQERTPMLVEQLLAVWEDSVRATHLFLSDDEINSIKPYVPQAIEGVARLYMATKAGQPVAFMGTEKGSLEMLFIASAERGKGLGKQLLERAERDEKVERVTVNEQNPQAIGFYEHMGFSVYKRTDLDEQGNPYPPFVYAPLRKKRQKKNPCPIFGIRGFCNKNAANQMSAAGLSV